MTKEGIYSILWEHRAMSRDKRGRCRGGTTAITPSLWGWMGQSVIQQTFIELLWEPGSVLDSYCSASLVTFEFSLAPSHCLSYWFYLIFLWKQPKQSLSTMCPYASWSLVPTEASSFWVWILSSKRRESRDLTGWFYYNQVVEEAWGPSHLFLCPLSRDKRSLLCEGNTASFSK